MKKVRPVGPWVLVNPVDPPEQTEGGLYLPQGNMEERMGYYHGVVEALGPGKPKYPRGKGRMFEHSGLEVGDTVYFRGFIKDAHKINPQELGDGRCLLHQDDILGVIEA